jgi:hypothetical protein
MKTLFKIALAGAAAAVIVQVSRQLLPSLYLAREGSRRARADARANGATIRDADPDIEEPLQPADLKVAQNAPF